MQLIERYHLTKNSWVNTVEMNTVYVWKLLLHVIVFDNGRTRSRTRGSNEIRRRRLEEEAIEVIGDNSKSTTEKYESNYGFNYLARAFRVNLTLIDRANHRLCHHTRE